MVGCWYLKCELITSVDQFWKFFKAVKIEIEIHSVSTQTMPISSSNYPIIKFNSTRDYQTEFLGKIPWKKNSIFWRNQNCWCLNNSADTRVISKRVFTSQSRITKGKKVLYVCGYGLGIHSIENEKERERE